MNYDFDVFVKDRQTGKVTRGNVTPQGALGVGFGVHSSLNSNGEFIALDGVDDLTLVTNKLPDVYLRQRF